MIVKVKTIPKKLLRLAVELGWEKNNLTEIHAICMLIMEDGTLAVSLELFIDKAVVVDIINLKIIDSKINAGWGYFEQKTSSGLIKVLGPKNLKDNDIFFEMLDDFYIPK